jgi:hypothetical protein
VEQQQALVWLQLCQQWRHVADWRHSQARARDAKVAQQRLRL